MRRPAGGPGRGWFGKHSRLHTFKVQRLSLDLPIVVEIVDTREKLEAFLAHIDDSVTEGLVTLEKAEVRLYRASHKEEDPTT